MKCLVHFRFLSVLYPLGESVFDSSMNISGCAVYEIATTPCLSGGAQGTACPCSSALYLEGGRDQGINHFLHSMLVGEGAPKTHPPSCTKEDLGENKRRETFPLVKFHPADKPTDVMA